MGFADDAKRAAEEVAAAEIVAIERGRQEGVAEQEEMARKSREAVAHFLQSIGQDPDSVDVRVIDVAPAGTSGSTYLRNGSAYRATNWHMSFSFDIEGEQFDAKMSEQQPLNHYSDSSYLGLRVFLDGKPVSDLAEIGRVIQSRSG